MSSLHRGVRSFSLLLIVLTLFSSALLCANAQTKVPLTHETMWSLKRVGAPVPSPDGKWVVFSLVEPAYDDKDQVSDLWIVPADASARPNRAELLTRQLVAALASLKIPPIGRTVPPRNRAPAPR